MGCKNRKGAVLGLGLVNCRGNSHLLTEEYYPGVRFLYCIFPPFLLRLSGLQPHLPYAI